MDFLWTSIQEWLKEILVSGIMSNLSGLFDSVNEKVAGHLRSGRHRRPRAWNSGIFNMIENLSETVILPIAGVILAFVMTLELESNHHGQEQLYRHRNRAVFFFRWISKTVPARSLIVTNHMEHRHGRV